MTFEFEVKLSNVNIQIKVIEQYFPLVLFILLLHVQDLGALEKLECWFQNTVRRANIP